MLVWTGDTAAAPAPVSPPAPGHARTPLTYTPPHLTDKILAASSVLEGERKQVTVLFADLKGSLELLADRDPEEARQLLDPVLERMMAAVHRYEGTVNQIMGGGIMALFGAPIAHEDHAVQACYAALAMQAALRRYSDEVRRTHGLAVHFRIGLNAGEVVVRAISNDLHMDYSAIGQTVHLAARMEQLAMPGSILLAAATLRLVEGLIRVHPLGPIPVKGLAEPVEVYEEEDLQIAEALQQPGNLLMAHLSRREPLPQQGQFHDAVPRLERAMALYTPELIAWYPMTADALGFAYAMTGRLADALQLLEQAVERARRVDRRRETQWLAYLSEAYLRAGRLDEAHAVAERLLALGRERGERSTQARGRHLFAEIAMQREPPHAEGAEAHYRKALALAEELGMCPLQAHCHRGLGILSATIGQAERAHSELATAIAMYQSMGMTYWLPQTEAALAQVAAR
jgi:class 3 adenylate cyclase